MLHQFTIFAYLCDQHFSAMRLDVFLVERQLLLSREKAQLAIAAGLVLVNDIVARKTAQQISPTDVVQLLAPPLAYVSKGGDKLAKALQVFAYDCHNKTVLDIGASTGGFTDCVLQAGAQKVYAVDVGSGQLVASLRENPKVVVLENTHIKDLTAANIDHAAIDLVVIDVSFISLSQVLGLLLPFCQAHTHIISLIKPQFEAGQTNIRRGGIVTSPNVHISVIKNLQHATATHQLFLHHLTFAPIQSIQKNIEYLALWQWQMPPEAVDIAAVVQAAQVVQKGLGK